MANTKKKRKDDMIAAFGERYKTIEHDGGYLLYDKEAQSRIATMHYIGQFYLSTDLTQYTYHETRYSTPEEVIQAMDDYNKTLPFDIEIYNPVYRKNYFIDQAVRQYLESVGFEIALWDSYKGTTYNLKDAYNENLCVINVEVEEDTTKGTVCRQFQDSSRWTEVSFTDLDSAIGACNSIIAMHLACLNARAMKTLNGLTESRASCVLNKKFDIKTLAVYTEDAKQKTIEYLEAELKRLKGE